MVTVTGPVHAGRLHDFEKAATKPKATSTRNQSTDTDADSDGDGDCSGFWSCVLDAFFNGTSNSSDTTEAYGYDDAPSAANEVGTPNRATPTLGSEVGAAYQAVGTGVHAYDLYASGKLGLFDINGRATHFMEANPPDTLDVYQANLVFPIRLGDSTTFGVGVGLYQLSGSSVNTGYSFSLPIVFHISTSGWRFRVEPVQAYINGNTINDVDGRVTYRLRHLNLFVGYREMQVSGQILEGPYVGTGYAFH